jgi:hypothetical protein
MHSPSCTYSNNVVNPVQTLASPWQLQGSLSGLRSLEKILLHGVCSMMIGGGSVREPQIAHGSESLTRKDPKLLVQRCVTESGFEVCLTHDGGCDADAGRIGHRDFRDDCWKWAAMRQYVSPNSHRLAISQVPGQSCDDVVAVPLPWHKFARRHRNHH